MTTPEAFDFVRKHGIVLESARGPVRSLAERIAGEPIRGSWWSHPKGREIFRLTRLIREWGEVVVCRLIDGKVTYVHRALWAGLVTAAKRFPKRNLAAIQEIHTVAGKHQVKIVPFPHWVPKEILSAAQKLTDKNAAKELDAIVGQTKIMRS